MAKKVGFGAKDQAAPRDMQREIALCAPIRSRQAIRLLYKTDTIARIFHPHFIHQPKEKWLIEGYLAENRNDVYFKPGWHSFEIGLINSFSVTDNLFEPDPRYSLRIKTYRNLVCSVYSS